MRPLRLNARLQTRLSACHSQGQHGPRRNSDPGQSGFSRPSKRAISASSESMSPKGSSTFTAALAFGSAFALSVGGRAGAKNFGAPSEAGDEGMAFGVGRATAEDAFAGEALTFVTVGAAGGAVFAAGTA